MLCVDIWVISLSKLGWPDWANFSTVRLLFVGSLGFFKQRNDPKIGDTFGYKFITFSAKYWHYLAWQLFWLLFKKYWAIFFKIIWSPWSKPRVQITTWYADKLLPPCHPVKLLTCFRDADSPITEILMTCGLYYKYITIVMMIIKVNPQAGASLRMESTIMLLEVSFTNLSYVKICT